MIFWKVAVNAPLNEPLTYKVSEEFQEQLQKGLSVKVPLGRRSVDGVLVETTTEAPPNIQLKSISEIQSERPCLSSAQLEWAQFLSSYYLYPLGQILEGFFPPLSQKNRRGTRKSSPIPKSEETPERFKAPTLNEEQTFVLSQIERTPPGFSTHLLYGVTGSGKTEIYIKLIEKALAQDKQCLVLVPEISLTPQLVERFAIRFPDKIAVIHSHLTEREKTDQWWNMVTGTAQILIGARSSLFCPIPRLGLIIVDEEHEASFKQDEKLKYHGRDAAVMRGRFENCPVILGSATPSLESWNNAMTGKYRYHELKHRVSGRPLPQIEVVDMRIEREKRNEIVWNERIPYWMSQQLYMALEENFQKKKQSALFLNRRGVAQSVIGAKTDEVPHCPNCDISLTLHNNSYLLCHYCDYSISLEAQKVRMGETELKPMGMGTELIEADLQNLFPSARIKRADRDEIISREDMEDLLQQIEQGHVDILVGTQMIAKGLDFPQLTLVGLVLADVGFNLPDFRACERSFQLMSQVSGRPGRHEDEGRVIIQTLNPTHPSLQYVLQHDFKGFAQFEMGFREALHYPPAGKLLSVRLSSLEEAAVKRGAEALSEMCRSLIAKSTQLSKAQVLGPAKAPLSKLRNQFRYQFLIKAEQPSHLQYLGQMILAQSESLAVKTKVLVDLDPQNLM